MAYVILCRVSTDEQKKSGAGINGQIDACREFVKKANGQIATLSDGSEAILLEEDFSGSLPLHKRPVLIRAIDLLRNGDVLLVHKRDRMFRGDPFSNGMIEHEIGKKGASLRSVVGEGTENNNAESILMRRIFDAVSEYEINRGKERTRTALRAKRRRGELVGSVPYGYELIPIPEGAVLPPGQKKFVRHLKPIQEEQDNIDLMREMRDAGLSLRAIVAELGLRGIKPRKSSKWSPQSIKQILDRQPIDAEVAAGSL